MTTATDVYALGVLMYLLLGGEHPTAAPTGAPLDRMRSVIETVPKRLSEAVLRRGGPTTRFSPESRKLSGEVKGDIETIVAKALKKSPSERYANAAALADDIRRYLAHEPIAARPDSPLYRATRFVQRHRAGVAMASRRRHGAGRGHRRGAVAGARGARAARAGRRPDRVHDRRPAQEAAAGGPARRARRRRRLKALDYYAAQDLDSLDADSLGRRARALHMIGDLAEQRGTLRRGASATSSRPPTPPANCCKRHPDDGQRIFDQSQSEFYLGYVQWRRGQLHEAEAAFRRYLATGPSA